MFTVITAYSAATQKVQDHLHKVIVDAGCTPVNVDNLNDTVEVLREQQPGVLIVGQQFDSSNVLELIPIFKHLQRDLKIILLADSASEGFLRQARAAGIFYHALEPDDVEDCQELQLALQCAREAIEKKRATFWQRLAPIVRANSPS